MGKYEDALKEYKKALHYNGKLSDAHYNASLVHIARYRQDKNKEHLEEAVLELQQATEVNAEHSHAHKELAKAYQDLGDFEKAIIRYKLALEIDPQMSDAWISLANLYTLTGQTLKAQQALNKALELSPNSAPSHLNMGLNFLKDDNFRMALKEFQQAALLEPSNELAYFNIGFTYYKKGVQELSSGNAGASSASLQLSSQAYESAFQLRPTYTEAAFNIGYNHTLLKDPANAIPWYKKALESDQTFSQAHFALAIPKRT
jgi:tetratricopeptide (TPR) repeat protein